MINKEREEDLETLLHHLTAAQRILWRLKWRGDADQLEASIKKSRAQLRKVWRAAQKNGE
jgi:hypothetical protein